MKKMQAKAAGAARRSGLSVRSNIKAGDFLDDMRSMYSSAYNKVASLAGGSSSASAGGAAAGAAVSVGN